MSVEARLKDCVILYGAGRKDGALLMVLVAVAATARKRYPRGIPSKQRPGGRMGDKEAFTQFLKDELSNLMGVKVGEAWFAYRGSEPEVLRHCTAREIPDCLRPLEGKATQYRMLSLEDVLYLFLRNSLVHEGVVSADVLLGPSDPSSGGWITGHTEDGRILIGDHVIDRLYYVVKNAPENGGQPSAP